MSSNHSNEPAKAVDAATVIIVREKNGAPQVYLMARHSGAGSFAGAHVFPGGVKDQADSHPDLAHYSKMPEISPPPGFLGKAEAAREKALGLYLCALRETFEEAGVLFASGVAPGDVEKLSPYRRALNDGKATLLDMAKNESLRFRPDLLIPYERWITPEHVKRRYDTRFFLARLPEGQKARPDGRELTSGIWVSPEKAMAMHEQGRMNLMPPTFMTLHSLSLKNSVDDIFSPGDSIEPVMPQAFVNEDEAGVLLPNDPDYSADGVMGSQESAGGPSRIVMNAGKWEARFHDSGHKE